MGNQCCCDDDVSSRPVDPNVLVWRPEAPAGKRSVTAAELRKRDEQLDAALDRIAQHQPDDPSPRQSVPKAAEVAEFRRSQLSQHHGSDLTDAERCFLEARPHQQMLQPPAKIGQDREVTEISGTVRDPADVDSNDGLAVPSDTSYPAGDVPQHEVQWLLKYDGEAADGNDSPKSSGLVPPPTSTNSAAARMPAEGRAAMEVKIASSDGHVNPAQPLQLQPRQEVTPVAEPSAKAAAPATAMPARALVEAAAKPAAKPPPRDAKTAAQPAAKAAVEEDDDIPLLPMRFQLPDKSFQDVYFFAFPIGFDLGKQTPLTVRGVKKGSYAEQLGVEAGWKICEVGGVQVSHLKPQEMLQVLAEQKKKYLG